MVFSQIWNQVWRSRNSVLLLSLLVCLLLTLSACGSKTPPSIVQQALSYEVTHPLRQPLAGQELLVRHTQIKDVKVRRDQSMTLLTTTGEKIQAHQLTGTFTLSVTPPGAQRAYRRQAEPFQIKLLQMGDDKTWTLAYPVAGSNPQVWSTVEFLPKIFPEIPKSVIPAQKIPTQKIPTEISTPELPDTEPQKS